MVDLSPLTATATGGSPILSYVLLWDAGTGAALTPVVGDATPNTALSVTVTTGVTSGTSYVFAYKARNAHGDGAQSATTTILAATVPSIMNKATVSTVSQFTPLRYRVSVIAPFSGGAGVAISGYQVEFKVKGGSSYQPIAADCDGTQASFVTNLYCDVNLASLVVAPFSLVLGDEVIVRVRALNVLGPATAYSADSTGGGVIVTIPQAPALAPARFESGCTQTGVAINMPAVTGASERGGLPITSYQLEWDQGSGSWAVLVGQSPLSTSTTFSVTGLTTGTAYSFRYRVHNEVGPSATYSPVLSTFAAVAPSTMVAPTTAVSGLDVQITWTAPTSNGGLAISAYRVFIRSKAGTYLEETAHCAVATLTCSVPLLTLQATPYSLVLGDLV